MIDLTKQLQQIELQIFREFLKICKQENLHYYLIGGTLLGAVRHQGFIPWDDDIDVGMPRKDYEIFLQKAQNLLPSDYFLQIHKTDPEYPLNFAKIRNSNTTFIETSISDRNINHGVYIDIFPLDYYPTSKIKQFIFDIHWKLLHFRLRQEFVIPREYQASYVKRTIQNICMFIAKCLYPSAEKAIQLREKLMKSTPRSIFMANFCGAWGKREIVPTNWYGKGYSLRFEGLDVIAPQNYDRWLTRVYGNYMKLPPKEKQVAHHYTTTIDLKNSYKAYLREGGK